MSADIDIATWARTHQACFETTPLIEMRGSERIQVGYIVDFYVLLPLAKEDPSERHEAAMALLETLRGIAEKFVPKEDARVEIEPARAAPVLRPENEMKPELNLRMRVFHSGSYFTATSPEERDRLSVVEKKLSVMGLRSGHW